MIGTSAYMAPEVATTGQYDQQADIFGLGVVMRAMGQHMGIPPNSGWWNLANRMTDINPHNRPLAWDIRDQAKKAFDICAI